MFTNKLFSLSYLLLDRVQHQPNKLQPNRPAPGRLVLKEHQVIAAKKVLNLTWLILILDCRKRKKNYTVCVALHMMNPSKYYLAKEKRYGVDTHI